MSTYFILSIFIEYLTQLITPAVMFHLISFDLNQIRNNFTSSLVHVVGGTNNPPYTQTFTEMEKKKSC